MNFKFFNIDSFNKGDIKESPLGFRYGYYPNIIHDSQYETLVSGFPETKGFKLVDKPSGGGRKRFYVGPHYSYAEHKECPCGLANVSSVWKQFFNESRSSEFISFFSDLLGVKFNMIANFGLAYGNEGCMQEPHIDGATRGGKFEDGASRIACILYFNENPDTIGGTCVYEPDRKTVIFQAPHLRNGLFFFEQHPDSWHGFAAMPAGTERRILSLAYGINEIPVRINDSFI